MPIVLLLVVTALMAGEAVPSPMRAQALLQRYCAECHMGGQAKGHLDLDARRAALPDDQALLDNLAVSLEEHEMPPKRARQPMAQAERDELVAWLRGRLAALRAARPQDPGVVVVPRLNHDEYDRVIADLTGLHLGLAATFPRDGGGGEGFSNVGEAQTATPVQVERFLTAAKTVAQHVRPGHAGGLVWSDHELPVLERLDERRAELEAAWLAWFAEERNRALNDALVQETVRRVGVFHGAAWEAAWRYHHRAALGQPQADLAAIVAAYPAPLSPAVVARWYALLTAADGLEHDLAALATAWRALPAPGAIDEIALRKRLSDLERRLNEVQVLQAKDERRLSGERKPDQAWEKTLREEGRYGIRLSLAKLRGDKKAQIYLATATAGDGPEGDVVTWTGPDLHVISGTVVARTATTITVQAPALLELAVPAQGEVLDVEATAGAEASVQVGVLAKQPDTVPEVLPYRLVLGTHARAHALRASRRQAAQATGRTQPEALAKAVRAAIARGEPDTTPPKGHLAELAPYRLSAAELWADAAPVRRDRLAEIVAEYRAWQTPPDPARLATQQRAALMAVAERAWRGPLADDDRAFLDRVLQPAQGIDGALRRAISVVLLSPRFLYRIQASRGSETAYALSDLELASRLSFALWASIPDERLMRLAGEGRLRQPEVIRAEALRMLADPRAAILAHAFGGIWLGYAGFDRHDEVDRQRFPQFTDALRQAMYDEITSFVDHLLRGGAPVTDVVEARYTWLNATLAEHYGVAGVTGPQMRRVDLPASARRGGVLGMAAILTATSKPLRTSPVLRGDWVLEKLLGVDLPPPPANVPMLSDDERDASGRTLLEQLRIHRDNPACASCHAKMDPLGLTLENYDPIGRWRERDGAGAALFTEGAMPDGSTLRGIDGLRGHVRTRMDGILDGLCRKTVGWFLGRAYLPSDDDLRQRMRAALAADGHRFAALVAEVVASPQFRNRRDSGNTP